MNTCKLLLTFCCLVASFSGFAQNPIIQTYYTADPAPMVYKGKVYLYTSHDEDETVNNFFTMYDWRCYSSDDMVNWTDHGAVASLKNLAWINKTNGAWAPQAIERNGKFYLYVPIHGKGISVLVSDSPIGPFHDPLGHRLIMDSEDIWIDIDPTVFIDDDGQAYLFWGNPKIFYVKLNEDMISYDQSIGEKGIISVEMNPNSFGESSAKDGRQLSNYTEGPWLYKRNDLYYLIYAAGGIPEKIAYSTARTVEGPWSYQGYIMERAPQLAFTNHPGIVDFNGNSYFFYHDQILSRGEGFKRSVSLEQFEYNEDGTIPMITPTKEGVKESVKNLDPFQRVEAETIAWSEGVKTAAAEKTGVYVSKIDHGDYIKVRSVDFADGADSVEVSVFPISGGKIEIRADKIDGEVIATIEVSSVHEGGNWSTYTAPVNKTINGVHDVYLVFSGEKDLFYFDWWKFN